MTRDLNREEVMRIAAEKVRLKKEKEAREEREFYERITSGRPWLIFRIIMVFCTLMAVATTIDVLVDGPSKKLTEKDCQINREWEWRWHQMLDVEGYLFAPEVKYWYDRDTNSLKIIYSPIFRTGKKLSFNIQENGNTIGNHEEIRDMSIFNWFPLFQIALLIPLFTYIFKRQSAWFNFARMGSMVLIFPGTLLVILFALS